MDSEILWEMRQAQPLELAGPYSKSCAILEYGTAGWVILKIWEFRISQSISESILYSFTQIVCGGPFFVTISYCYFSS